MTAQHTSLIMALYVSLPSLQPLFAHIPIFNSNHTYQHIHIYMTSTDPGRNSRVLAQGHPMGLLPCLFWAGYYEGGVRGLSWEVVPAKTHCGSPMREVGWGWPASWVISLNFSSDANVTCGSMCFNVLVHNFNRTYR